MSKGEHGRMVPSVTLLGERHRVHDVDLCKGMLGKMG